jgi:fatty acid desaturase
MGQIDHAEVCSEVLSRAGLKEKQAEKPSGAPHHGPLNEAQYDRNLWYIHGNAYDLAEFVPRHPGGQLAILSGRGRDCTALFESYHPWNDKHRKLLKAFNRDAQLPDPDPFFEDLRTAVQKAYPAGAAGSKMRWPAFVTLWCLWAIMIYLFFVVKNPLLSCIAGLLMGTVGTRLSHEGAHNQISTKPWVNRLSLFLGYFPTGPSMIWHYRHVISHHAHTNQEGDVDVEYIWIADLLPGFLKALSTPFLFVGVLLELGPKGIFDLIVLRRIGGCRVDFRIGHILPETAVWLAFHYYFGPSLLNYLSLWFFSGAIFVPCSQVAHAIVFPDHNKHDSWARLQVAESVDFATGSEFWFHFAIGLTHQVEHHLFPGLPAYLAEDLRKLTRGVCERHGVVHHQLSAKKAFSALWQRWVTGMPVQMA